MSSGMNREQAKAYAETMSYKEAISNIWSGKGIKYRKATLIKLHELAEIADSLVLCKDCKHWLKTTLTTLDGEPVYDCHLLDEWGYENGFCSFGERREP